ncbi:hypothetical protein [Actinoplanes sp. N902-109]|uniref:hypothetical protein n=1 Tax=Actinoplanes sp. (strain N902-109) TaxID=649831 RepID=UPI0012F9E2CD|nr:hypothetical protein [Actinoplanes sp. N902-109]
MAAPPTRFDPDLHTVVFDVNVLLDVADLVGPPFTWEKFNTAAARNNAAPVPNSADRRVDSLRAVAVTTTGFLAKPDLLQVWTSDHIDRLLVHKAAQPRNGPNPESRGLGWTTDHADLLLANFLDDLVYDMTGGGRVEIVGVSGHPPLDHEDACVFTTACEAARDVAPPPIRYCVTRDRGFRSAAGLAGQVSILYPDEFVRLVRRSRAVLAMRPMKRPLT